MAARDFNREYQDGARKYAYDFDTVVRRYMMQALAPHFVPGRALELGCYRGEVTELIAGVYTDLTVVEASSDLAAAASNRAMGCTRMLKRRSTIKAVARANIASSNAVNAHRDSTRIVSRPDHRTAVNSASIIAIRLP